MSGSLRPSSGPRPIRVVALICGLLATAHALVYVFAVPPWALEDEEQHVDYVLELRDDHRVPRIDEHVREAIIRSTIATDRWGSLGLGPTNPDPDPSNRGLEGLSYEGYQPPVYYAALALLTAPVGDRLLGIVYLGRLVGAVLAGVGAAMAALLAARWCACGRPARSAWVAGTVVAAIPAYAEAMARVNNDTGLVVLTVISLVVLMRWVDRPTGGRAAATGLVIGITVGTKITGLVLLAPALVALLAVWRRVRWQDRALAAAALAGPAVAVAVAWAVVSNERYGVFNPVTAVIERIIEFPVIPVPELAREAIRLAGLPFGHWRWGPLVAAVTIAVVVVGLILSAWCRPGGLRWLLVGALAAGATGGLLQASSDGVLNAFSTRYVLFAYPPLLAAAATGWAQRSRAVAALPIAGAWIAAVAFFVVSFHPRFPFRLG